jgi:septal ring factor EnvC (AmiA/AmiB activator)
VNVVPSISRDARHAGEHRGEVVATRDRIRAERAREKQAREEAARKRKELTEKLRETKKELAALAKKPKKAKG